MTVLLFTFSASSVVARASFFAFIGGFLTFMAIGGFPSFVEDMKIFGRERLNGHYGVTAFVISNTLSSIPFLLVISVIPGALAYYISGLRKDFDRFIYFVLMLFAGTSLVESLMMIIASIVPDFLMGITAGAGIQGLVFLMTGFLRLPNDLPNLLWKYPLHYVLYGAYVYEGLLKNEFQGLVFTGNNQTGVDKIFTGEEIIRDVLQAQVNYSKRVNLAVVFAMVVLHRLVFLFVIKMAEISRSKWPSSSDSPGG